MHAETDIELAVPPLLEVDDSLHPAQAAGGTRNGTTSSPHACLSIPFHKSI